jgi:hypothetical protein
MKPGLHLAFNEVNPQVHLVQRRLSLAGAVAGELAGEGATIHRHSSRPQPAATWFAGITRIQALVLDPLISTGVCV